MDDKTLKLYLSIETEYFKKGIKEAVEDAEDKLNDLNKQDGKDGKKGGIAEAIKEGMGKLLDTFGKVGVKVKEIITAVMSFIGELAPALMAAIPLLAIATIIGAIIDLVAKAVQMVKNENGEVQSKIQIIKAMIESMAYTLVPYVTKAIEWILNAIIQAIRLIQHIVYAIAKIDILKFTGDRLAKNMKSAATSAREMKKQLMGFDEANVINDNGGTSAVGTGGIGDALKELDNMDLSIDENYFEKLFNDIMFWINKIKETIGDTIHSVEGWFRGIDISKIFPIGEWELFFRGLGDIVGGFLGEVQGLFMMFISGPLNIIFGLITGNWEQVWRGCKDIIMGFVTFTINSLYMIWGAIETVVGFLWGVSTTIAQIAQWCIKTALDLIWNAIQTVWNLFWDLGTRLGNFLWNVCLNIANIIIDTKNKIINTWNDIKKKVVDKIVSIWNDKIKPILDKLKTAATNIGDAFKNAFKTAINFIIKGINKMIDGLNKIKIDKPSWLGGGQWGINIPKIPELDTGGIVLAQPGHGVPVGNAIMSERRSEAVIPFENPTAMERIGEAIGRYVNIAIQNQMVVDGKVLASATNNQINKERFLMNR